LFQRRLKPLGFKESLDILLGSGVVDDDPHTIRTFFLQGGFCLKYGCRACQASRINFFHINTSRFTTLSISKRLEIK
jgi:hypothetical protein